LQKSLWMLYSSLYYRSVSISIMFLYLSLSTFENCYFLLFILKEWEHSNYLKRKYFELLNLFELFLCPRLAGTYSVTHVRNSEIKQLLTLFFAMLWDIDLVCGCIMISYRSSLRFVPVQWFLAELWPLDFEIWPNI
jgi:hypothetical protein